MIKYSNQASEFMLKSNIEKVAHLLLHSKLTSV